jgi:hypothetical protein
LATYGLIWPLKDKSIIVLAAAAVTFIVKVVVSDLAGGEFTYYKQGHDFCLLALGTSLSSLALQLTNITEPYLKALPRTGWPFDAALTASNGSAVGQQLLILATIFAACLIFSLLTAIFHRDLKNGNTKWSSALSGISFCIVSGMFICYVLLLIVKD